MPFWPKVPLVIKPAALACLGDRLTWTGASPDGLVVRPSGLPESEGPETDSGEEVTLGVAPEVASGNVLDGTIVNVSGRKKSSCDKSAEPSDFLFIDLVVIRTGHSGPFGLAISLMMLSASSAWR